jgi:hypothetical protein
MNEQDFKQTITMINDNVKDLRVEIREGFAKINEKLDSKQSKEVCDIHRKGCTNTTVTNEWSVKKVTAIGGAATAIITAAGTLIGTLLKAFGII